MMAGLERFGLDVGIYGSLAEPGTIIDLALFAEDTGFGSIWLADHVAMPVRFASRYPYSPDGGFPAPVSEALFEPLATLGVLAGGPGPRCRAVCRSRSPLSVCWRAPPAGSDSERRS